MQDELRAGYKFLALGRFRDASECCRRLIGARRDLVEAHFLVGLIAFQTQDLSTAVQAFGSVTTLNPKHAAGWAQLARLYARLGHSRRADRALEQAVAHDDGNPVVHDLIGTVWGLLGEQSLAAEWTAKAVCQRPGHVPFLVNLANNEMFLGRFDAAEKNLRKALSVSPANANAHWVLSNLRKASDRAHIDEMRALVTDESRQPRELAYLWYALGKEYEDLEDWDAAFAAFAAGAAARRATLRFDEDAERAMFAALETTLTAEWLDSCGPGDSSSAPIFIVGQPRTGTTLAERIVTSHSAVHSAGELQQFGRCLRRLVNYEGPGRQSAELVRAAAKLDPQKLGAAYIMTTEKFHGQRSRFVDKLPTNYRYIPLMLAALPNARILHIVREPLDACFASFKQLFADAYLHSYEQREMARHHARYRKLMQTWRERFPDRFLDVSYEALASNTNSEARRMIEFLDLDWEDACLEFDRQTHAVTTASAVQVREGAHTRSIGRWLRYEKQLAPLHDELLKAGVKLS